MVFGFANPTHSGTIVAVPPLASGLIPLPSTVLVEGQVMKTGSISLTLSACTNGIVYAASGVGVLFLLAQFAPKVGGLFPLRQFDYIDILVTNC